MKTHLLTSLILAMTISLSACAKSENKQLENTTPPQVKAQEATSNQEGLFPAFKVKDFKDQEINLADYRGKIVILDLFATWCPPCRMEIPHFVELQNEYKDDLAVVGLSYDQTGADKVLAFAKELNINYDMYWGSQEIAKYVGLRGIPHTIVLDKAGKEIKTFVGYRDKAVFEEIIKTLL